MSKIKPAIGPGLSQAVGLTDTPEADSKPLGWITFEKVTRDHSAIIATDYGDSLGVCVDRMIAEYKARGEELRSIHLEFASE